MIQLQASLVLASRSPRRSDLLRRLGFDFEVIPSDVDEAVAPGTDPSEAVREVALRKAGHVADVHRDAVVLGADTVVVLAGQTLGKPVDATDAARMLRTLSGRTHTVHTGIALVHHSSGREAVASEATEVSFGNLSEDEIAAYVRTGSPLDKAGAYGIQDDLGALLIDGIRGDYYNVVGLPLRCLYLTLRAEFGDLLG